MPNKYYENATYELSLYLSMDIKMKTNIRWVSQTTWIVWWKDFRKLNNTDFLMDFL